MPIIYRCGGRERGVCDFESEDKWRGRCPGCGRPYNILVKGTEDATRARSSLATVSNVEKKYIKTGLDYFDEVIGGGIVPGAPYIISGPNGVGKSTLLLTVASLFATESRPVLYASGEQSRDDIGDIAGRINSRNDHVDVMGNKGEIEDILERAEEIGAKLVMLDSINTASLDNCDASEGSSAMMKAVANRVTWWCKKHEIALIALAHVNAEGELSGPTSVPHLFDTILELDKAEDVDEEGDVTPDTKGRIAFSSAKNRHGESGVTRLFRMSATGIVAVRKKSKLELV